MVRVNSAMRTEVVLCRVRIELVQLQGFRALNYLDP